jgi:hypothetical protein
MANNLGRIGLAHADAHPTQDSQGSNFTRLFLPLASIETAIHQNGPFSPLYLQIMDKHYPAINSTVGSPLSERRSMTYQNHL